ncbi:MAG: 16S rRNA (cytidine(1402)-2'-O)-methyltransferase [Clostridia bacterium]|nr:16S rRNA (cytidine(1402)-2'-O)-methyltransferase [Clostridia bacterium]
MSDNNVGVCEKNITRGRCLYLVATPIGNLSDMSERALKVLSEVDFIAAEDTRNSLRLLTHFGISKPLISYFEHNKRERGEAIIKRLGAGESCALITDAGTPAISDPGEDLVRLCAEHDITVISVPGACAAICALTLSGLATARFCFEGFLPVSKSERRERLEALKNEDRTIILHEAPHKLRTTLADLASALGNDRKISLCRELTKLNEQVIRTTLGEAIKYYDETQPRGEYVLVISGTEAKEKACFWQDMTVEEHLEYYINEGTERREAVKKVAHDRGVPKNDIYKKTIQK